MYLLNNKMENDFFLFNEHKEKENLNNNFKQKLLEEELKKKKFIGRKIN